MACGDANKAVLMRAAAGRTGDAPCDGILPTLGVGPAVFCGQADVEAWGQQARHVFGLVRSAWNRLWDVGTERGDHTQSEEVRAVVTAYETRYGGLPEPNVFLGVFGYKAEQAIGAYQASIAEGACMLEQLNARLTAKGEVPFDPGPGIGSGTHGTTGPDGLPWWVWAAAGALLIGAAYGYGRVA